jgi:alkylation response protein AidB-like acyl-CoA dehydrogenase
MLHYRPPLRDIRFLIEEWLGAAEDWRRMPGLAHVDAPLFNAVLEEGARFAADVLAPLNAPGDAEACRFDAGSVQTPRGFRAAYARFVDAGWPALCCAREHGGQGLPQTANVVLYEMCISANHAWSMYPAIVHGAYECLERCASPELKREYLARIVSGEWLATMCLTEAGAGSDLGLLRCRAEPAGDGSFRLSGTKIFISGGAHDLTPNIVHLVLARLPDAPAGSLGISLFLVPAVVPGERPVRNAVHCDGIEHKMGLRGSATCTMHFDGAAGWLVGLPHQGLGAMFVMMNGARLMVAIQGVANAELAHQNALRYAAGRRQGRSRRDPGSSAAEPIIRHAPVRQLLLDQRATIEGQRALVYWVAHLLDVEHFSADVKERDRAGRLVSFLTPICKAACTERGFLIASSALQVFGGYGYVRETGIEQVVRDARVAMIYEGTNEIQALELVQRKLLGDGGRALELLLREFESEAERCAASGIDDIAGRLREVLAKFGAASRTLLDYGAKDPEFPARAAVPYLNAGALACGAYAWARSLRIAWPRCADEPFYEAKCTTARWFFATLLPEFETRLRVLDAAGADTPTISDLGG